MQTDKAGPSEDNDTTRSTYLRENFTDDDT